VWDFAELNPFADIGGSFGASVRIVSEALEGCPPTASAGHVEQLDSTATARSAGTVFVCTDPPYYDNVPYADLSDFFYVWLRRSIGTVFPDVCSTLLVPKVQELVATPYRFDGDKARAERFFEEGLGKAFERVREAQHRDFPVAMFYAFKQAESVDEDGHDGTAAASTGWETMLEGLIAARFAIVGTWPMRTERTARMRDLGSNALASSVVLVARSAAASSPLATRKEFLATLKRELPTALIHLQHGNIAPVDLAQAAIGPGMAVFSRYSKVIEADGSRMPVRTALGLINQILDEVLAEQESEFDGDTRWALAWFEQYGINEGPYGDAETLSKAKDTAVSGLEEAGILEAKRGKVRLLRRMEMPPEWDPATDRRLTVWEVTQHLIRRLEAGGESSAAELLRKVGGLGNVARDLAYRLYSVCERKGWAQEATAYNGLVTAWPELTGLASQVRLPAGQSDLFGGR
jgi:putative DNA methylase